MAEVRMETQVDPLAVMILTIQMAMVDKEDHLTEGVTMETLEEVAVTNHTTLMGMVDKEAHSMEEVIMETMEVAHLVATTLIIQMEMVDKEDHSMAEVIIIILGEAAEDIFTVPVQM